MNSKSVPHLADLELDDALNCLSNERRRYTIEILDDHGGPLPLSEVAERVATRQNDIKREELTSKQRKCAYSGLYQAHMGKLTDVNAVEFDERSKVLKPGENTTALAKTIRQLREQFYADRNENAKR